MVFFFSVKVRILVILVIGMFCFEVLMGTCEEVVSVEEAVQFAVHEVEFSRGFEANAFEGVLIRGDNPSGSSSEGVFEGCSDGSIKGQNGVVVVSIGIGGESLSVRRVDDD